MWFHIDRGYLGKTIILNPRVPDCCEIGYSNRYTEGNIPRICVSDTIYDCIRGILGIASPSSLEIRDRFHDNPCVYFTEEYPYIPPDSSDFRLTNEHWFLTPTKFKYLARVDIYRLITKGVVLPTEVKEAKYPKKVTFIEAEQVKQKFLQGLVANL